MKVSRFNDIYGDNENPLVFIVGTMHGDSACTGSYTMPYSYHTNRMWLVLPAVFGERDMRKSSNEERIDFLKRHRIAMLDLLESCDRVASSDSTITNAKPNDFNEIVEKWPGVRIINMGMKSFELFSGFFPDIEHYYAVSTSGACHCSDEARIDSLKKAFPDKYEGIA